jgi:hypothetical protein
MSHLIQLYNYLYISEFYLRVLENMKFTQNDIGGEIISIITRGMYDDPKDALREYVQNAVDAEAENISIKIRQNLIVVQDDGYGMDENSMRKAVRVGVSEKNPKSNVGFMGIGLYSSFHLCDTLTIYSKVKDGSPHKLTFDFLSMRQVLDFQKENRLKNIDNQSYVQVALQSLLEKYIQLVSIQEFDFPNVGTRIELSGVETELFLFHLALILNGGKIYRKKFKLFVKLIIQNLN